jgi:hypothetical protein
MNFETRTLEDKLGLQKKDPTQEWESFRNKKPFKPPSWKIPKDRKSKQKFFIVS